MSRVIESLKLSLGIFNKNSWVVGIVLVMNLISLPSIVPLDILFGLRYSLKIGILIIFTIPLIAYIWAGLIGIVEESLGGDSNLETFKLKGKKNFLRFSLIFLIFVVFFVVYSVFMTYLVSFTLKIPIFIKILRLNTFLYIGLIFAPQFIVVFFMQFVDVSIVVTGYGIIKSFKESFRFVWGRKRSVFCYNMIIILFGLLPILYRAQMTYIYTLNKEYYLTLPLISKIVNIILILGLWTIYWHVYFIYHTVYYIQAKEDDSIG